MKPVENAIFIWIHQTFIYLHIQLKRDVREMLFPSAGHLIVAMTRQSEQVLVRWVTLTVFLGGVDSVNQSNAVASAFRQKYPSVWIWQENCPGPLVAITALIPRLCASGRGNFLTWLNCFGLISPNGKEWVKWSCQGLLCVQWLRFGLGLPFGCRFEFRDLLNDWFSTLEFITVHLFCVTCQSALVHHTSVLPDAPWK